MLRNRGNGEPMTNRIIKSKDFHQFFRSVGIGKNLTCPRCGSADQFGWSDDPEKIGDEEWSAPPIGADIDPGKDNFFQFCDRCGFVEVYFLKQFYQWFDQQ